jgi:hypothetical protein
MYFAFTLKEFKKKILLRVTSTPFELVTMDGQDVRTGEGILVVNCRDYHCCCLLKPEH